RPPLSPRKTALSQPPAVAVPGFRGVEPLPRVVWEPSCGPGAIVRVLRDVGHRVYASDLVNYGCEDADHGVDFLMERTVPYAAEAIVTNPPYKLAGEFVSHALDLDVAKVVMLLRLQFLESERRGPILDTGRLARVYVFRNRLPRMHRDGWNGPKATSRLAFAWFVFERDHTGPATLSRISWEATAP